MDRPDEVRHVESFKRLTITDFKVDIPRAPKKKVLAEALKESGEAGEAGRGVRWFGGTCPLCSGASWVDACHAAAGAFEKFAKSSWGKKLAAQKAKPTLTDMDRFKVMLARKKKAAVVRKALKSVKA